MRNAAFWICVPVVFVLFIAVGYAARPLLEKQGVLEVAAPPAEGGWCCVDRQKTCVASASADECFDGGGSAFDVHKDVCLSACRSL